MSSDRALVVRDLACSVGSFVLGPIDFELRAGTIVGLVGPNGAGKTTLLSSIAGLRRHEGTVELPDDARSSVAFVEEEPALFPSLTVAEHLRFVELAHRATDGSRVAALRTRFGLDEHADKQPRQLSLGARRKTALAMGLLQASTVFLFDEPLNGLDPSAQRELRDALLELRHRGASVMVSSHWLPELERVAGTFLVIDAGRIVAGGTLDELRAATASAATADLEEVYFAVLGRHVAV